MPTLPPAHTAIQRPLVAATGSNGSFKRNYHRRSVRFAAAPAFEQTPAPFTADVSVLPDWHRRAACRGRVDLFFLELRRRG